MHNFQQLEGQALRDAVNASRFDPRDSGGFYESHFVRANHPSRPLAFWIRYTVFNPKGHPQNAVGQLWATYFDGESSAITALKQSIPISECQVSPSDLRIRIGRATLDGNALAGSISKGGQTISWDMTYHGNAPPVFLLPMALYDRGFPKAKALTGIPLAVFAGSLNVGGRNVDVSGWTGSQNHNWGEKHTDMYAWGQVAGFDTHPGAFLECSTARLKIGPMWTPWLTNVVLRAGGRQFALNSLSQTVRNRGSYRYFDWSIEARQGPLSVRISIAAPKERFVALAYDDPPGGTKTCLNSKLASCKVVLTEAGHPPLTLETASRAAFEILTTNDEHGITIAA